MSYVKPKFVNSEIYHVYNRGVEKRELFSDASDYQHFLDTLSYFREQSPTEKLSRLPHKVLHSILIELPERPLVTILGHCLMPNHFHLLLRQEKDGGVTSFMRRSLNSYTHYYNRKYERVGTMFQGRFQAVHVRSDEQFLHVSRYIHLNPSVARLVNDPLEYPWSSIGAYRRGTVSRLSDPTMILTLAGSARRYQKFVTDYADYARSLADLKHILLDI